FVLVLCTSALMMTQRSITSLFSIYAAQSLLMAIMAVVLFFDERNGTLIAIAVLTILTKVIIIPYVMRIFYFLL
ncbi:MAG: hypothetical protein PHO30_01690, partial [Candidatus Omnitrophica bacterium]|nr:hypothetical protein [Candidatus Omnitrophota bacterium]